MPHVLLMNRADWPGFWQSVTGSLEADEAPYQCAIREVAEETGITATLANHQLLETGWAYDYAIYERYQHRYPPGVTRNTEHWFVLALPNPLPVRMSPREHTQFGWFPLSAALYLPKSPSNRSALMRLWHAHQNGNALEALKKC